MVERSVKVKISILLFQIYFKEDPNFGFFLFLKHKQNPKNKYLESRLRFLERFSIFNRLYQIHFYNGKSQAITGIDPLHLKN